MDKQRNSPTRRGGSSTINVPKHQDPIPTKPPKTTSSKRPGSAPRSPVTSKPVVNVSSPKTVPITTKSSKATETKFLSLHKQRSRGIFTVLVGGFISCMKTDAVSKHLVEAYKTKDVVKKTTKKQKKTNWISEFSTIIRDGGKIYVFPIEMLIVDADGLDFIFTDYQHKTYPKQSLWKTYISLRNAFESPYKKSFSFTKSEEDRTRLLVNATDLSKYYDNEIKFERMVTALKMLSYCAVSAFVHMVKSEDFIDRTNAKASKNYNELIIQNTPKETKSRPKSTTSATSSILVTTPTKISETVNKLLDTTKRLYIEVSKQTVAGVKKTVVRLCTHEKNADETSETNMSMPSLKQCFGYLKDDEFEATFKDVLKNHVSGADTALVNLLCREIYLGSVKYVVDNVKVVNYPFAFKEGAFDVKTGIPRKETILFLIMMFCRRYELTQVYDMAAKRLFKSPDMDKDLVAVYAELHKLYGEKVVSSKIENIGLLTPDDSGRKSRGSSPVRSRSTSPVKNGTVTTIRATSPIRAVSKESRELVVDKKSQRLKAMTAEN